MSTDSRSIGLVFLVTCGSRPTDPLAPTPGQGEMKSPLSTPRVMPIKAIPSIIFRSVCYLDINITIDQLCEIWDKTFEHVTSSLEPVRVTRLGLVSLFPSKFKDNPPPMVPRYSGLLSLVEPQLKSYLPDQEWTPSTLEDMIDHVYSADADSSLLATRDWWAFTAIIFAMLYAAACKSLSSHKQHSSLIEVAVDPGILPVGNSSNRAKFKRWISVLQEGTECPSSGAIPLRSGQRADGAPIHEWAALHYELFSGATIEPSITNSRDFKENILGFSKHGIFVIRDIALNPSLRPESLVEFHIQQGQPIAIPVDEKGFIVGQCDTIADDISDAELGSDMDEIEETPVDINRSSKSYCYQTRRFRSENQYRPRTVLGF